MSVARHPPPELGAAATPGPSPIGAGTKLSYSPSTAVPGGKEFGTSRSHSRALPSLPPSLGITPSQCARTPSCSSNSCLEYVRLRERSGLKTCPAAIIGTAVNGWQRDAAHTDLRPKMQNPHPTLQLGATKSRNVFSALKSRGGRPWGGPCCSMLAASRIPLLP